MGEIATIGQSFDRAREIIWQSGRLARNTYFFRPNSDRTAGCAGAAISRLALISRPSSVTSWLCSVCAMSEPSNRLIVPRNEATNFVRGYS